MASAKFIKKFMMLREKEKPSSEMDWAYADYYKFCMNSKTLKGGTFRVGDSLELIMP